MIDKAAFRSLSYGLYIVTTKGPRGAAGCVANTFAQVTSDPARVSVALNKDNATTAAIVEAGVFEAAPLTQSAPMELIGRFGFHTSADTDKFADTRTADDAAGVPYVAEHTAAHFLARVRETVDLGTHLLIVGDVEQAETLSSEEPMTYAYYHRVKGGKTPPKAPSYQGEEDPQPAQEASAGEAAPVRKTAWRCTVCGHVEYVDELPEGFVCPVCGVGREMFERIEL